ncbi:hypothetical protein GJAV_G00193280 [Gymnothorax javanicus]|nr:hypothetical protein GJAV_G00193280 [Gymnothorax javanicus]
MPNTHANRVKLRKAATYPHKELETEADANLVQGNVTPSVMQEGDELQSASASSSKKENEEELFLAASPNVSIDSSKAEEGFFRLSSPQQPCFFFY